uniref:Uncharacterized protein n=1 Tax=Oryza nivara TaxID=4536 RepID=A0A679BCW6_ORYNI|nr:hypothetical protein [Oryza sativa f. spontanea]
MPLETASLSPPSPPAGPCHLVLEHKLSLACSLCRLSLIPQLKAVAGLALAPFPAQSLCSSHRLLLPKLPPSLAIVWIRLLLGFFDIGHGQDLELTMAQMLFIGLGRWLLSC